MRVASFTDAWIETFGETWYKRRRRRIFYRCVDWNLMLPVFSLLILGRIFYRCVDWNISPRTNIGGTNCRIFYRCVDWNPKCVPVRINLKVASFTDAWIETYNNPSAVMSRLSRIFYRCVDWNHSSKARLNVSLMSHPLRGQLFIIFFARRLQD